MPLLFLVLFPESPPVCDLSLPFSLMTLMFLKNSRHYGRMSLCISVTRLRLHITGKDITEEISP